MAKITDLAAVDAITGDEFLPIVQRGATKRATMSALRALIVPFLQAWYKGDKGDPGAAGNVAATIDQLRSAPTTASTMIAAYDGTGSTMTWTEGDFTAAAAAYPAEYVGSTHAPLSTGAWVRQNANGLAFSYPVAGARPRRWAATRFAVSSSAGTPRKAPRKAQGSPLRLYRHGPVPEPSAWRFQPVFLGPDTTP